MTTTRLSIYNGALLEVGERKLASLSENRESRRALDEAWDGGAVDFCLNAGQWKFAKRSVELAPETSVDPGFGYQHAYAIPDDFIRTCGVFSDEYMQVPLIAYSQEAGYWFSDTSPIYVSYVSNDAAYGGDLTRWPQDFVQYVQAYLASRVIRRLTQDKAEWKTMLQVVKIRLRDAKSGDAMESPTMFPPTGSWVRARLGRNGGRRDRGNRSSLTG